MSTERARAPRDPELLTELRRRISHPGHTHVELTQRAADDAHDGEALLILPPEMQHIAPPEAQSPCGILVRWPLGHVERLLRDVGAVRTADRITAARPPEGHVWAVWVGVGCALAAPWPRTGSEAP